MTPSDAELLCAAQSDDPQAFRELYERYAAWIRGFFQRQTGSETVALDLTAETFAQAWHARRRFRDLADGSAAPWLFGIARNLLRQYHKHNRIETAARERLGMPRAFAECDDYEAVDERQRAGSLRPALWHAVAALPSEQRLALQLRVVDQLDYDEVAGRLGCTRNAARLRVSRALRALTFELGREDMKEQLPEDLARLGAELERAIAESLRRKGRRRRAVARAAAVLSLGVPVLVGAAAGPLAPADGPVTVANPMHALSDVDPGTAAVLARHIPDEPLPDPTGFACLDARDCPSPVEPSLEPAPAGRV